MRIGNKLTKYELGVISDIIRNRRNYSYFIKHQRLKDLRLLEDSSFTDTTQIKLVKDLLSKLREESDAEDEIENEKYTFETFVEVTNFEDLFGDNFEDLLIESGKDFNNAKVNNTKDILKGFSDSFCYYNKEDCKYGSSTKKFKLADIPREKSKKIPKSTTLVVHRRPPELVGTLYSQNKSKTHKQKEGIPIDEGRDGIYHKNWIDKNQR